MRSNSTGCPHAKASSERGTGRFWLRAHLKGAAQSASWPRWSHSRCSSGAAFVTGGPPLPWAPATKSCSSRYGHTAGDPDERVRADLRERSPSRCRRLPPRQGRRGGTPKPTQRGDGTIDSVPSSYQLDPKAASSSVTIPSRSPAAADVAGLSRRVSSVRASQCHRALLLRNHTPDRLRATEPADFRALAAVSRLRRAERR